ncbi:ZP domain-containing protein-like [Dendronephthya gigantea]|uniref:ZP domain-containing protein-like n=1 Tax=Dendronephthya gigantea TaxID=151771 RepID=UPI00106A1BCD|nr:ZP domain-containing protein-like [Dendronephthya gigantea]
MSFSNDATIHIPFSRDFISDIELSTAIDGIDYSGGGTATAIALKKAYEEMFQAKNGARKTGVSKVLIILTDGQSNGGVEGPALNLKNAGVIIFSVGIGQNINMDELYSMASQPKEQRVILLEDFQELSTLAEKMSSTTCNENFGNLTFLMKFYKDSSYQQSYIDDDYPVSKSLSDRIHVQYSVDSSSKSDIVIRAKTCRATPTNKPYDQPQHVFIDEGCDKDSTIQHYTSGLQKVHRFSIQAFAFVINHRYVYFHCDLVLCNRNTANSICARSTSCPGRKRRGAETADDGSKFYQLSTGPLIYRKKKDEANSNENSSLKGHGVVTGLLFAVAVLAIVLISIFGILFLRRRRTKYETSSNVQVLSMENTAATKE